MAQEEVDAILFRESNGGQSTAHQALSVLDAICRGDGTKVLGQKFNGYIYVDVLEDSQYLLISTCEENLPKDSQRIPETCTPKPPFPWNIVAIPLSSFSLLPPLLSTSFIPFSSYTPLATPCVFPRF